MLESTSFSVLPAMKRPLPVRTYGDSYQDLGHNIVGFYYLGKVRFFAFYQVGLLCVVMKVFITFILAVILMETASNVNYH